MKSVRIFYAKTGRMKFVSHLDMNRLMPRLIRKSGLPVWYTEGFNRHIYINYAVPLSLGFEGVYEVMDIRLTDDRFDIGKVTDILNSVSVPGLEFLRSAEPVKPTKDIVYAEYSAEFENTDSDFAEKAEKFFSQPSVICRKTGKKGKIREINIIPLIKKWEINSNKINLTLTAGNENNLNPTVVINAFFENCGIAPVYYTVKRLALFDSEENLFV